MSACQNSTIDINHGYIYSLCCVIIDFISHQTCLVLYDELWVEWLFVWCTVVKVTFIECQSRPMWNLLCCMAVKFPGNITNIYLTLSHSCTHTHTMEQSLRFCTYKSSETGWYLYRDILTKDNYWKQNKQICNSSVLFTPFHFK